MKLFCQIELGFHTLVSCFVFPLQIWSRSGTVCAFHTLCTNGAKKKQRSRGGLCVCEEINQQRFNACRHITSSCGCGDCIALKHSEGVQPPWTPSPQVSIGLVVSRNLSFAHVTVKGQHGLGARLGEYNWQLISKKILTCYQLIWNVITNVLSVTHCSNGHSRRLDGLDKFIEKSRLVNAFPYELRLQTSSNKDQTWNTHYDILCIPLYICMLYVCNVYMFWRWKGDPSIPFACPFFPSAQWPSCPSNATSSECAIVMP